MFVLRSRLERILKAEVPDVVILYSDSDLSNQNEDILSIQEKYMLREHYRANFTLIVESILATKVKLALSGIGFSKQYITCRGIFNTLPSSLHTFRLVQLGSIVPAVTVSSIKSMFHTLLCRFSFLN